MSMKRRLERSILMALAFGLVPVFVKCAAPQTCVRISDCDDGWTCSKGACVPADPSELDPALASTPSIGDAASEASDATSTTDSPSGASDAQTEAATDAADASSD